MAYPLQFSTSIFVISIWLSHGNNLRLCVGKKKGKKKDSSDYVEGKEFDFTQCPSLFSCP